ncbi:MAG: hypothetical protein, partial [Olavius algarvensis Gamma 1 endosymbiont]
GSGNRYIPLHASRLRYLREAPAPGDGAAGELVSGRGLRIHPQVRGLRARGLSRRGRPGSRPNHRALPETPGRSSGGAGAGHLQRRDQRDPTAPAGGRIEPTGGGAGGHLGALRTGRGRVPGPPGHDRHLTDGAAGAPRPRAYEPAQALPGTQRADSPATSGSSTHPGNRGQGSAVPGAAECNDGIGRHLLSDPSEGESGGSGPGLQLVQGPGGPHGSRQRQFPLSVRLRPLAGEPHPAVRAGGIGRRLPVPRAGHLRAALCGGLGVRMLPRQSGSLPSAVAAGHGRPPGAARPPAPAQWDHLALEPTADRFRRRRDSPSAHRASSRARRSHHFGLHRQRDPLFRRRPVLSRGARAPPPAPALSRRQKQFLPGRAGGTRRRGGVARRTFVEPAPSIGGRPSPPSKPGPGRARHRRGGDGPVAGHHRRPATDRTDRGRVAAGLGQAAWMRPDGPDCRLPGAPGVRPAGSPMAPL